MALSRDPRLVAAHLEDGRYRRVVTATGRDKRLVEVRRRPVGFDGEDADPTEMNAIEKASAAVDRINDLADRVDDLEDENQRLRSRLESSSSRGKDAKVADIVQFADNARGKDPAIKLTAKDIQGATGCSTRYAYDLMDDLPEEYDWFLTPQEMTQYGSLEVDNTDERRLGVDFEGVHSSGCPLNKFNNGSSKEGSQ
jgi:hypothetical protein